MKSRLVPVLALVVAAASLTVLGSTSASAATYTARLARTPIAGEVARITGAVRPAGRPVGLQRYVGGRWVKVSATRTGSEGRYSFGVRAVRTSYAYRSYAPRTQVGGRTYGLAYSRAVRVTSVTPRLSLTISGAPVGQSKGGTTNLSPATAVFRPARPGTAVGIQRLVNGTWTRVAGARQNAAGAAYFQVRAGTASAPGTFRAYSRPTGAYSYALSTAGSPRYLAKKWSDEFGGTRLDTTKWRYRLQAAGGNRVCSTPASAGYGLTTVGRGVAQLRVRKIRRATSACPYGTYKNAMIEASGTKGFQGRYGVYAARVKFQTGRGMHGSFWMQGPSVTGAEIDVAEYFGDGRVDSGLASFVHYTDSRGRLSSAGGIRNLSSALAPRRTPSNGYHVYSVEWTPSRYVFRVDGNATLVTSRPRVASSPESLILSLLSSDYELPHLSSTAPTMAVDWVRVWQ